MLDNTCWMMDVTSLVLLGDVADDEYMRVGAVNSLIIFQTAGAVDPLIISRESLGSRKALSVCSESLWGNPLLEE